MRKIILSSVITLLAMYSYSQTDTSLQYSSVIQLDSIYSKEKLFEIGSEWLTTIINNSAKAVQTNDKEAGLLIAGVKIPFTLIIPMGSEPSGYIQFNIRQ